MKTVLFPTLEETLFLHQQLIEQFGGSEGVLDMGLVESALARPRFSYYRSLTEQAAALMHSFALNHCFVDGNQRMAFAIAAVFLKMNGYKLIVDPVEGERFIIEDIISHKKDVTEISAWIAQHILIPTNG